MKNTREVQEKIHEISSSQPQSISQAEQESLDLKRKELSIAEEKEKNVKTEKSKKLLIEMEALSKKCEALSLKIQEIGNPSELSDQDVRQHLMDSKQWENKLDSISTSKVNINKDAVGIDVDQNEVKKINDLFAKTEEILKGKVLELKKVDKERCLYSLSKPVKEPAVYPSPFGGTEKEDVYKFKEKMLEAIVTNQIREKDKVAVLRQYLKGKAKDWIGEHYESIDKAFEALLSHFGLAKKTWEAKVNEFIKVCNKPQDWIAVGTDARTSVIGKACEFIREAEKLAVDHPDLKDTIIGHETVGKLLEVIPPELKLEVQKLGRNGPSVTNAIRFSNIKSVLEEHYTYAKEDKLFDRNLQANAAINSSIRSKPPVTSGGSGAANHDCSKSKNCNEDWGGLGCCKLYFLPTVEERREFLKARKLCFCCGFSIRDGHSFSRGPNARQRRCSSDLLDKSSSARCKEARCFYGAAVCNNHPPNNAKDELLEWLSSKKIRTTVTCINSSPINTNVRSSNLRSQQYSSKQFSKNERIRLQKGQVSANISDEDLAAFFADDLKLKGEDRNKVLGIPKGQVSFIFCKIKGKNNPVQTFIDNGCNCCIMRDGIPEKELRSAKLEDGPIEIDVATGIKVYATGEWASVLPLTNGYHQVVRGLTVNKVTAKMPIMKLQKVYNKIKNDAQDVKELQRIQVPEILGGEIDMILGIKFQSIYPEPIHHLPNGMTIYKSKFIPARANESACIGGPIECINQLTNTVGASDTIRYLSNFLNYISANHAPKIDFFPSYDFKIDEDLPKFADSSIPHFKEYLAHQDSLQGVQTVGDSFVPEPIVDEDDTSVYFNGTADDTSVSFNGTADDTSVSFDGTADDTSVYINGTASNTSVYSESPEICGKHIIEVDCDGNIVHGKCTAIQAELRKFLQWQEAGNDVSFRCIKCRNCKSCLKGAGEEMKSLIQEAHQEVIRESVSIDKKLGRGVAKLPFISDPVGKLTDNERIATRRLDAVCRKYGSDKNVVEMINAAFQKLINRGHIVFLDDVPQMIREKILNAKASYFIPWDIAFKEGSVSTPARPVMDASSKTPGGCSLNDLLAKPTVDVVKLIDMVVGWRIGPSAFIRRHKPVL